MTIQNELFYSFFVILTAPTKHKIVETFLALSSRTSSYMVKRELKNVCHRQQIKHINNNNIDNNDNT